MKLFREPLLYFLIAGGALFAVYAWLGGNKDGSEAEASRTVAHSRGRCSVAD